MNQSNLFQEYCIDTCAILDFWDTQIRTRPYHVKVKTFRIIWNHISSKVASGSIVVPKIVADEIKTIPNNNELKEWLDKNKNIFVDHNSCIGELQKIVNKYPIYTTNKGSLEDAIVIAIAMGNNLTVVTSEIFVKQHSAINPKIPNVCEDFSIKWMNLPEFFEAEGL